MCNDDLDAIGITLNTASNQTAQITIHTEPQSIFNSPSFDFDKLAKV